MVEIVHEEMKQSEKYPNHSEESQPHSWDDKNVQNTSDTKFATRVAQEAEMEIVMYLEYAGGKAFVYKVKDNVRWQERFESTCGEIHAFLYERSIFALSGNNDSVTLIRNSIRKAAINKKIDSITPSPTTPTASVNPGAALPSRKTSRVALVSREKNRQRDVPMEGAGKIAIACISQAIDLEAVQRRFRQWDYITTLADKVLHVTRKMRLYENKSSHASIYSKEAPIKSSDTRNFLKNSDECTLCVGSVETDPTEWEDDSFQTDPEHFDLFVFSYGAFVWWGYDMSIYKTIEMEFTPLDADLVSLEGRNTNHSFIQEPYQQKYVKDLFPVWCTYEITGRTGMLKTQQGDDSVGSIPNKDPLHMLYSQDFPNSLPNFSNSAFLEALQRDHILLPIDIPAVKQAISHALAQSAKLDIIEPGVRDLLSICKPLPMQIKEHGSTTIKHTKVNQLKGELFLLRMELKSDSELFDEPEFFWEFPWFKHIFLIVRDDYGIESRISLLDEKLSAVQLTLDMIGNQFSEQHGRRLEWIIIILILIEVLIAVAELLLEMGYGTRLK